MKNDVGTGQFKHPVCHWRQGRFEWSGSVWRRGRGLSEHDRDWKNYTVPNEMRDVLDLMMMMELTDCGIIGTSRGGLITMVMAAAQPARIGAAVLNDIGPVIETQGLMRIAGYVGRTPLPKSWSDAARIVRDVVTRRFRT